MVRDLILKALSPPFASSDIGKSAFRTALETVHAALMEPYKIVRPAIELGLGDGISSLFVNRGQVFNVGLDMPIDMTNESRMFDWHPEAIQYREFVGASMEAIPYADGTFATVYSSETMFYGMDLAKTASEIARILAPGGTFYCFMATDAWDKFPSMKREHMQTIVGMETPSDEAFGSHFTGAGLVLKKHVRFFSPALEIFLQKVRFSLSGLDPKGVFIDQLAELLAYECDRPDGFHSFWIFDKPGEAVHVPYRRREALRCVECGGGLQFTPDWATCPCGTAYPVRFGVPMMVKASQRALSPKLGEIKTRPNTERLTKLQADYERECVS